MKFAIIGMGRIGQKRFNALSDMGYEPVAVCDSDKGAYVSCLNNYRNCVVERSWKKIINRKDVDTVIVSTPNNFLAPITLEAVKKNKHVLVEKPAAIDSRSLQEILLEARRRKVVVRVGFNHRFHPAFIKADEILKSGKLGRMMFVRGCYGHGGRVGYEKEWRAKREISGGGELIDQGVHLIDLAHMFLENFTKVRGIIKTHYWDMNVEDNAYIQLETKAGAVAWLHVSCTEWKNRFSFEVYGTHGKFHIEGLGGSYGTERLSHYKMSEKMGPPETTIWEFPGPDLSWHKELEFFMWNIKQNWLDYEHISHAMKTLDIVKEIYKQNGV